MAVNFQVQLEACEACEAAEFRSDEVARLEETHDFFDADFVMELYFRHGLDGAQSIGFGGPRYVRLPWAGQPKVGGKSGEI